MHEPGARTGEKVAMSIPKSRFVAWLTEAEPALVEPPREQISDRSGVDHPAGASALPHERRGRSPPQNEGPR
jgi:hypothetical protein